MENQKHLQRKSLLKFRKTSKGGREDELQQKDEEVVYMT